WLNTGVVGLALVGMFIVWLLLRADEIWRSPPLNEASELDWTLARAATIIVALLIAHSFVDYPLRTGGIMAIMAFACGLLIDPPTVTEMQVDQALQSKALQTLSEPRDSLKRPVAPTPAIARRKSISPNPPPDSPPGTSLAPDRRWGADMEWPGEWSEPSG